MNKKKMFGKGGAAGGGVPDPSTIDFWIDGLDESFMSLTGGSINSITDKGKTGTTAVYLGVKPISDNKIKFLKTGKLTSESPFPLSYGSDWRLFFVFDFHSTSSRGAFFTNAETLTNRIDIIYRETNGIFGTQKYISGYTPIGVIYTPTGVSMLEIINESGVFSGFLDGIPLTSQSVLYGIGSTISWHLNGRDETNLTGTQDYDLYDLMYKIGGTTAEYNEIRDYLTNKHNL